MTGWSVPHVIWWLAGFTTGSGIAGGFCYAKGRLDGRDEATEFWAGLPKVPDA